MRVLIIGCGYVGLALGEALAKMEHEVFGVRRTEEGRAAIESAGLTLVVADITNPKDLAGLPGPFDWVVNTVSSSRGGVEEYRQIYRDATANLVELLRGTGLKKYVYTSSTSVYGQTDGSAVKESSATCPDSETGKVLVETESILLEAARTKQFPAIVLRVAGIYGPDRGHLFLKYLRNEARMAGRGERIINMIHRDDLVGAIRAVLDHGNPGEIYNVVDDEPVAQIHFFRWLSESLGKYMPPYATEEETANRKRGLTQKKVSNRKLKMELGYAFQYPTFRQGYTAEITRLDRAGLLHIEPESRDQ